jgi:hypothetical protein
VDWLSVHDIAIAKQAKAEIGKRALPVAPEAVEQAFFGRTHQLPVFDKASNR